MSLQTKPQSVRLNSSRFTAGIERRVLDFVRKRDVLRPREHVLVAASGGPDSTALLTILARLSSELGLELTVAHFNHMLRGEDEASADLDFVRSLASALEPPLVHGSGDVRARARSNRASLEDTARRLRYAFLAEQAALAGASCVVTGHTLDDQAETVLLHLIRGSGLDGLAGMRPRSPWPFGAGPDIARPLLNLRRGETERYCGELGVTPRLDPTNELLEATRNRVRVELVPLLRQFNPRVEEALARMADAVADDAGYLGDIAEDLFEGHARVKPWGVSISRETLRLRPRAESARFVKRAFERAGGEPAELEASHVSAVLELARQPPGMISLPGGISVSSDSYSLLFHKGRRPKPEPIDETRLHVPGVTRAGRWLIKARLCDAPVSRQADPLEAHLDPVKTGPDLTVRSRRPGDRLRPLGLGGEKKLQDILVDAKVPAAERDGVPLVCAGDQIAWVVGHCIDERYALDIDTLQALHLVAQRT